MENSNKNFNILLDLFSYKIDQCRKRNCKKKFKCKFYHNSNDKRRCIIRFKYYSRICERKNNCNLEKCKYSHNNFELWYHPSFYKTNYCQNFFNNKKYCKYKEYCCNAHSDKEIRIELLHFYKYDYNFFLFKYKTSFCPIKNINHKKDKCIYAHNYQDFRRLPLNNVINAKCKNWPNDKIPDIYTNYCKFDCNQFHGWKEFGYHFLNYKEKTCSMKIYQKCDYNLYCPKIHNDYEIGLKNLWEINKTWKLVIVPKNQIKKKQDINGNSTKNSEFKKIN